MFTRIAYDVTFSPTPRHPKGRTFSRSHDLRAGFGAIVGPNEQGKSLILELLRFSLFGSKALRGASADYVSVDVTAHFVLGDAVYEIQRTLTNAKLFIDGELVTRGTVPVNTRVRELLGFGLAVFDVANSINQGEIEALQQMRPADRAKLTGSVVGLDKIDDLAKYAGEQALGADRAAKTVELTLVAPVRPDEPESWPNRGMMIDFLAGAERDQLELAKIAGQLDAPRVGQPEDPGAIPTKLTLDQLKEHVADNRRHEALMAEMANLKVIDVAEAEAALDAYEAWYEAQAFLRQNPAPTTTLTDATDAIVYYDLMKVWTAYNTAYAEYTRLKEAIAHAEKVDCPSCGHTFPLDADDVAALQVQLDNMVVNKPDTLLPERAPRLTYAEAEKRILDDDAIEQLLQKRDEALAVPQPEGTPRYSRLDLERYDPTRASMIEAELTTLTPLAGAEALLDQRRDWEARVATYHQQRAAWEADVARVAALEAQRDELVYAPARVAELRPVVAAFKPYEQALARYEQDKALYDLRLAQVEEMRQLGEKWRAAKDALGVLRGLIKQHLYPSLAKAASVLLAGMTGGQRNLIEIDDEFNVLVDGQKLHTLSGSGKAVANLAIRLGLGQVLTHKAFPVIFADEIDAAMDDDRAASTQDILHQCASRVSQLILVSHKTPEADWFIRLGETSDRTSDPNP